MTNQQDAGEEEWTREPTRGALGYLIVAADKAIGICPSADIADQILADHAAARRARKLEERVTELEAVTAPDRLTVDLLIDWKSSHFTLEESRLIYLKEHKKFRQLEERVREMEKRAPLTRCPLCHVEPNEWVESSEPGALPICEACALDVSGPVFASPRALLPPATGKEEAG